MQKWKTVRIRQELAKEIEKEVKTKQYQSLSDFVSEAIRLRMQTLAKERVSEYLERDRHSRSPQLMMQSFYTPKHVWAQATPQRNIRIGITDYFQKQAKEIVYIKTDKIGEKVSKDEPFGMVETWWFVHDLYSPSNGKIVSINEKVAEDPFTLNADPHQWIVEIEPTRIEIDSWMKGMLSMGEYERLITKLEGQPTNKMNAKSRAHK